MPWSETLPEVAGASVEPGLVHGERAGDRGEAEAAGDAERRGLAGQRDAVGEPDGDEHHGQRADQRDGHRG
jgi:hypothetical protein